MSPIELFWTAKNSITNVCSTTDCCPLMPFVAHYYPLLPIVAHSCQPPPKYAMIYFDTLDCHFTDWPKCFCIYSLNAQKLYADGWNGNICNNLV